MKKFIIYLLVLAMLICTFSACSSKKEDKPSESVQEQQEHSTLKENDKNGVKVPDIIGTDLESAKTIVLNMGLVPIVKEDFSEGFVKGEVMDCEPEVGTTLEKGSSVTITVSKGRFTYVATNIDGTLDLDGTGLTLMDGWSPVYAEISNVDNTISITLQLRGLTHITFTSERWLVSASGNDARISLSNNFAVYSKASYTNTTEAYNNGYDTYRQTVIITAPLDVFNTDELPTTVWVKFPIYEHGDVDHPKTLTFKLIFVWDTSVTEIKEYTDYDDYNGL